MLFFAHPKPPSDEGGWQPRGEPQFCPTRPGPGAAVRYSKIMVSLNSIFNENLNTSWGW